MAKKRLIEMVCTGNRGRSPVAELIANNYLAEIGATDRYKAISSGASVDVIGKGEFPIKELKPLINVGLERDLYNSEEIEEIEKALEQENENVIRQYGTRIANQFGQEEIESRTETLPLLGIKGNVKTTSEQTIARPDTAAVLCVDKKNYDLIKYIYEGSGYNPIINVLSRYATGNPDAEVKNAFGLGKEVYKQRIEQLVREVPLAVDKIVKA